MHLHFVFQVPPPPFSLSLSFFLSYSGTSFNVLKSLISESIFDFVVVSELRVL